MAVKSYRELVVWQKGMDLVELIYRLTRRFPKEDMYGLTSQIRKAAVSIPSNIAEGQGSRTTAEFLRFLSIASGSLKEVETQVLIACRLGYAHKDSTTEALNLAAEIGRLTNALIASPEKRLARSATNHYPPTTSSCLLLTAPRPPDPKTPP